VQLRGAYNLRSQVMDFRGELLTDATLGGHDERREVAAGAARPAAFFRRKGGGSRLPIKISGPRAKPQFGLDVGRVF
jgi:hypothetical protein